MYWSLALQSTDADLAPSSRMICVCHRGLAELVLVGGPAPSQRDTGHTFRLLRPEMSTCPLSAHQTPAATTFSSSLSHLRRRTSKGGFVSKRIESITQTGHTTQSISELFNGAPSGRRRRQYNGAGAVHELYPSPHETSSFIMNPTKLSLCVGSRASPLASLRMMSYKNQLTPRLVCLKVPSFFTLSITLIFNHLYGVLNVGKKITNYTV
jgi:hypothetical protein